jgi:hypothetical protein
MRHDVTPGEIKTTICVSFCAITEHSKTNMSKRCAYLLPNDIDMQTLCIEASPDGIGH